MANNWAIAIGINHYEFFQPLGYAQADAQGFRDCLVQESRFLPEHCLLLTDTSPPVGLQSTYPNRANLSGLISGLAQQNPQSIEQLWFFFSGYGITDQGRDYLMPLEGDPTSIATTGISIRSLFQSLRDASLAGNLLVMLDMNRASGTQADTLVGQETLELAREWSIPTILSCQPDQLSREIGSLGHGFFTAALLEALRSHKCSQLVDLERYLSARVPELCRHHWRPVQNPVGVIQLPKNSYQNPRPQPEVIAARGPLHELESAYASSSPNSRNLSPASALSYQPKPSLEALPVVSDEGRNPRRPIWQLLMWWAGGIVLLIALGVGIVIRNKPGFMGQQAIELPATPHPPTVSTAEPPQVRQQSHPQSLQSNQLFLERARRLVKDNQPSTLSSAITIAQAIQPGQPLYDEAHHNIDQWSRRIFDIARSRANQGQFGSAIAVAELISKDQAVYQNAQQSIQKWHVAAKQQLSNQTLLEAAAGLTRPGQASSYNRALEVASKVPPNQPGSGEAQKLINQWSQTILSLATQRATQGQFDAAIQTAALVPANTPAYPQAQQAIQNWQRQMHKS